MLFDATPGPGSSNLANLTGGTSKMFCFLGASQLLSSDGTTAGTGFMPSPALAIANSGGLAVLGDTALVTGPVGPGVEMLATDGTAAGTVQLTSNELRPGMGAPLAAAPLLNELCFVCDNNLHGRELWRTNGTAAGTALIEDIAPGPADAVGEVVTAAGDLWFNVGGQLYRSNGTVAGRTLVHTSSSANLLNLDAGDNVVVFRTTQSTFTQQLWRSDGSNTISSPNALGPGSQTLHIGDVTYYMGTLQFARRLYRWQGEPNGGLDLGWVNRIYGRLGDRLVFEGSGGAKITDGTVAGTIAIGPAPTPLQGSQTNRRDGGTFLVLSQYPTGLYATDGTSMTTLSVPSTTPIELLAGGDDFVYMQATDPLLGYVLYRTDGTPAGTQMIADFGSLALSRATAMWPLGSGNRALLAVQTDSDGIEPWITDGTTSGTVQLADLNPTGSSNPELLGVSGSMALLVADDGTTGPELWRLDLATVAAANVQSIGIGCPGSFGNPRLTSGDTPQLGATFSMNLSQAQPGAIALWLLGTGLTTTPVGGGCNIYFQNLLLSFWNVTDAAGYASGQLSLPNSAALIGATGIQQVGVFDPLGVSPFGTSTTSGLLWVIGN